MSIKITPVDYTVKTNSRAITDRTKQSTAEDWNEVRRVTGEVVAYLHVESDDIALADGNTVHSILFDNEFQDTNYRVRGGGIVVYQTGTDENGKSIEIEKAIYNIIKYDDYLTFETYEASSNYRVDYHIMKRS